MKVSESRGGKIVVVHEDGYEFVFRIHDLDGLVMDLENVSWHVSGAPPDVEALEQAARPVAEAEAREQGRL